MKKIWDKEKHWFNKKTCLIFGIIAITLFIINIIIMCIWKGNVWPFLILWFLSLFFGCLALAPLISKLYL